MKMESHRIIAENFPVETPQRHRPTASGPVLLCQMSSTGTYWRLTALDKDLSPGVRIFCTTHSHTSHTSACFPLLCDTCRT